MLKRGNWSVEELMKLRDQYGRRPLPQLARELRRTEETVRLRAEQMFQQEWCPSEEDPETFEGRPGPLEDKEREQLRFMVGIADLETMQLVLGRQGAEIERVLLEWSRQKSEQWSEAQIEFLKLAYGTRPDWALSMVLGHEIEAIQAQARELCLGKDRSVVSVELPILEKHVVIQPQAPVRMPRWTTEEVDELIRVFPERPNLDIARSLGRSVKSVVAKANELGLRKSKERLREMGRENVMIRHKRAGGATSAGSASGGAASGGPASGGAASGDAEDEQGSGEKNS
ncbi:MAG: hypothetical protein CSA62_05090 [Planctomycetota bacterium]|nr:MAG: hypothetical protein CSA62_05090 [Planctomycetota bacterium]